MNLVGLYFFSFLICGHLLKKGLKKQPYGCNEEQSLSALSQGYWVSVIFAVAQSTISVLTRYL